MELGIEILKGLIEVIIMVLKNPFNVMIIVLSILFKIYYPKIRGYMGEFWVKIELKKLSKKEYIILNDIMIENENGTHQIDHIVISKFGIFVIEMKNYSGMIIGDEFYDKWTQYLGKNKYSFKNPIQQNYGHVKSLEELLKLENDKFIPIVCFSNVAKLQIKSRTPVVTLNNLAKMIKNFYEPLLDIDIIEISNVIIENNIIDKEKRKQHVKEIKNKIKTDKFMSNNMICPKCGSKLVTRNSRYGTFIGCSNYPKCRYIKK